MNPEQLEKITDWATALDGLGILFDKFDIQSADEWTEAHWSIAYIIRDYSQQIFGAASEMKDAYNKTFFHLNKEAFSSSLKVLRNMDPSSWRIESINALTEEIRTACDAAEEARSFLNEISSELDEMKKERKKAA